MGSPRLLQAIGSEASDAGDADTAVECGYAVKDSAANDSDSLGWCGNYIKRHVFSALIFAITTAQKVIRIKNDPN